MSRGARPLVTIGLVGGALLGALGWWLPWVLPRSGAAALVLLGLDLGDFWKFTNEWRHLGLMQGERLAFFLPPALAAIVLALALSGGRGRARWLALPLPIFLSLVILPAFEFVLPALPGNPLAYESAGLPPAEGALLASLAREFTFQLRLAAGALLALVLIPLWARLPGRARAALIVLVGALGATLPAWALWRSWPLLQGFYGGGANVGPGIVLTGGGFLIALIAALCRMAQPEQR